MTFWTENGVAFKADYADADIVAMYRWFAYATGGRLYTKYVMSYVVEPDGKKRRVYLHRLLLAASEGVQVDHVDGNGLNNRRSNLRLATHAENHQNLGVRRDSSTGIRGVEFRPDKKRKQWRAYLRLNGKLKTVGLFLTKEEAGEAAKAARARHYTHSSEKVSR